MAENKWVTEVKLPYLYGAHLEEYHQGLAWIIIGRTIPDLKTHMS